MPKKITRSANITNPLKVAPPVPAGLEGDYAVEYWKRITVELVSLGQITALHLESLEGLCRQWQMFKTLSVWMDENPDPLEWIVETNSGSKQKHPFIMMRQDALQTLNNLWAKFGLTPDGLGKIRKVAASNPPTSPDSNGIAEFAMRKTSVL